MITTNYNYKLPLQITILQFVHYKVLNCMGHNTKPAQASLLDCMKFLQVALFCNSVR